MRKQAYIGSAIGSLILTGLISLIPISKNIEQNRLRDEFERVYPTQAQFNTSSGQNARVDEQNSWKMSDGQNLYATVYDSVGLALFAERSALGHFSFVSMKQKLSDYDPTNLEGMLKTVRNENKNSKIRAVIIGGDRELADYIKQKTENFGIPVIVYDVDGFSHTAEYDKSRAKTVVIFPDINKVLIKRENKYESISVIPEN